MRRTIVAFSLLLASAATASAAQGLSPSVWQSQRGGVLKVLQVDAAHTATADPGHARPLWRPRTRQRNLPNLYTSPTSTKYLGPVA